MAMLAEPRQRKRYNLTPRGRALYEDDTRFGTKMLEKMGWSKGKGLGANENGSQDFVRVRMRNNNEGLGFEDRDDHWTQHEESFSGLLKALNGESNGSSEAVEGYASDDELPRVGFGFGAESTADKSKLTVDKLKEKFSGESLEEKSKRSKARVHYKKFTKGKDLSQYSEKDLANIFGKKVVEAQQANGIYEQLTAIVAREEKEEKEDRSTEEVNPNFAGVQTISTGLSVSEYFKQKMEAMKNRMKNGTGYNDIQKAEKIEEKAADEILVGEDNKKSKKKKRTLEERELVELVEVNAVAEQVPRKKKRKKGSEEKVTLLEDAPEITVATETETVGQLEVVHAEVDNELPRKKKKKKCKTKHEEKVRLLEDEENIERFEKDKKKKKATKVKVIEAEMNEDEDHNLVGNDALPDLEFVNNVVDEKHIRSKTKKNKNKKNIKEHSTESGEKSKKNKILEATNNETSALELAITVPQPNANKKSKKDVSATDEIANTSTTLDDLISKCNSYNVYTVSSFCAEKFRNSALELFVGSNLSQFPGYSYDDKLELNVKVLPGDEKRITQLWNCTIDKYCNADPKHSFHKYAQQVSTARKTKQKLPRFHVKPWKRRNAFQAL